MSGRGYQGGRSNYRGGGNGGRGRGGGRGTDGRTDRSQYNQGRNSGASEKVENKPERVMLNGKPTTAQVNNFFRQQENYAGEQLSKTRVSWIVNLQNPGDTPYLEEPERPYKADYMERTGERTLEDGSIEELFELNEEEYGAALFEFREAYKYYQKDRRQIEEDLKSLFSSLKTYLSQDARREIESKKGATIWKNEDPKELAEAIKDCFLTQTDGAVGNPLDIWEHRQKFFNIRQRPGQSVGEFLNFYKEKLEALKLQELSTGKKTEAQLDLEWSEEETASNFVSKLIIRSDWWRGMKFHNKTPPETLEDAFIEACNAEKEYNQMERTQRQYERINTYHASSRNDGRGNGGGSYSRAVSTGKGDSDEFYWRDGDGGLCCKDYMRGPDECTFYNCKFSHKQPRTKHRKGEKKGQEGKQETNQQIERATKEVNWVDTGKGTTASDPIPPPSAPASKAGGKK